MKNRDIKSQPRAGTIEAIDPFAKAPPGISLTVENKKWNWGNPPQDVDPRVVLDKAAARFDDPAFEEDVMKLLTAGVSVELLAESWMTNGFQEGKFTLDAGLLAKPTLSLYIAYLAEQNDVPYRFFERDDALTKNRLDNREFLSLMKSNNPNMFEALRNTLEEKFGDKE